MSFSDAASRNEVCTIYQNVRKSYQCLPESNFEKSSEPITVGEATSRPKTRADMVPTIPIPSFTTTLDSELRFCPFRLDAFAFVSVSPSANARLGRQVCLLRSPV
jgi:hypothetical protein